MGKTDGIHWGTGEDADSGIWGILPADAPTILNEPEAQWHWAEVAGRRPDGLTVWRSSPAVRPADVGWDAHSYSREVFYGLDAHYDRAGRYPTEILLLNELNLDYERGDARGDGGAWDTDPANWPGLYRGLSQFLSSLLTSCRERAGDRGFWPRFWYQGWAPGHGELNDDIAALWTPAAREFDGICYHAYTTAHDVEQRTRWHAATFPDKPLLLGEWNTINLDQPNSDRRFEEEIQIRGRLRRLGQEFPQLHACYFIYAWAEDARHEHDIAGNDRRLSIWDGRVVIPDYVEEEPIKEPEEPVVALPVRPLGVDVASYQGYPDWQRVWDAGYRFGVTKFTEGLSYINPTAIHNWQEMGRVGFKRGGYHWGRPTQSARQQAEFFWSAVQDAGGWQPGDFLTLDLEEGSPAVDEAVWAMQFMDALDDRIPADACVIYTGRWFIDEQYLADNVELSKYHLWNAAYQSYMPNTPAPWSETKFWQFSSTGRVPGIDSNTVDLDEFNGTYEALRAFGTAGGPEEPGGGEEPPEVPSESTVIVPAYRWEKLVSTVGYLAGDVAQRVEETRASVGGDIPRASARMSRAQLADALNRLWANVDRSYQEFGQIKDEMQRLGREAL